MAARRTSEQKQIEDRMQWSGEDYMTARKAVRREKLLDGHVTDLSIFDCLPDEKQLPDEGAWIQVIVPPHCEITCEPLSIWYALPVFKKNVFEFMEGDRSHRYKVKVLTPIGEFMLFPNEYRIVTPDSIREYMNMLGQSSDESTEHVVLHWLDPRNEYFDEDRLFYIMSRGVARADAYQMLMGDVKSQHVCYFTFHEEYQRMFAGVGSVNLQASRAVHSHIDFVNREKAAGRWYNAEYAAQRQAENQKIEEQAKAERQERDRQVKAYKRAARRKGSLFKLGFL